MAISRKEKYLLIIFLTCIVLKLSNASNFTSIGELFEQAQKNRDADVQENSAYEVIKRLLPATELHEKFQVKVDHSFRGNRFKIVNDDTTDGVVHITASSGTALTRGFYHYLKYFMNAHISWDGNQLDTVKLPYPLVNIEIASPNQFIYYQNVCTHSYSFAWWTWKEWRVHIDWMAMMGINFFIAPIQEELWSRVYRELGMTEVEIDEHLGGPAFLAWQRMGNTRGWGGPLSQNFKSYSLELQKQIIDEARDLGMTVALPGFAGHVPRAFNRLFPDAMLQETSRWMGFPDEFCCPMFLDSRDPLFERVGGMFMSEGIKEYGTDHFYFSDPYNELIPTSTDLDYIKAISNGIYNAIEKVDSDGIWLLQGWMFRNSFWTHPLVEAFVTGNRVGKMLILDLQSDQFPIYDKNELYYGQPFIWNMLHNFGGTSGWFGSMHILNDRPMEAKQMKKSSMVGFGITPEGIFQNYGLYEFALEMGWNMQTTDVREWVSHYATSRYGRYNAEISEAWDILVNTVYHYEGEKWMNGFYTFNKRPDMSHVASIWYETDELKRAWTLYVTNSDLFVDSKLFAYDLIDMTRQNVQVLSDRIFLAIKNNYNGDRDLELNNLLADKFIEIIEELDELLKTDCSVTLGTWLQATDDFADLIGDGDKKALYQFNARNQLTVWGPRAQIIDYANKQWSGLITEIFLPRWEIFFEGVRNAIETGSPLVDQILYLDGVEHPFVDRLEYSTECGDGDTFKLARDMYDKWINTDVELQLPTLPPSVYKAEQQEVYSRYTYTP